MCNSPNFAHAQNSRTTAGVIIYTDLDPNTVKANYLPIEFSSDDRVQYEEIRHETGAQVCEPSTGDKVLGKYRHINRTHQVFVYIMVSLQ